ncbi:hypothetical protein HU200_010828 [Digitaria exilis]|uniref:Uncharacterized protein n=1 Tax=Digitaria exilis TaxID=1010633 RepID=A0A835FHN6_9POAL|nr:hypothetical protein HU200_010828 [Digitaria exilis]
MGHLFPAPASSPPHCFRARFHPWP